MRHPSKKSELEEIFHEPSGGSAGDAADYPFPSAALSSLPSSSGSGGGVVLGSAEEVLVG